LVKFFCGGWDKFYAKIRHNMTNRIIIKFATANNWDKSVY